MSRNLLLLKVIPFSFFILTSFVFTGEVNSLIGLFLILTIGVLHGCSDLSIMLKTKKKKLITISLYVAVVIFALVSFFYFPKLLLVLFGILSCYHFGEQHLFEFSKTKNLQFYILSFFIGLSVLLLLFSFNIDETNSALSQLFDIQFQPIYFIYALIFSYLTTGFLLLVIDNFPHQKIVNLYNIFSFLMLLAVFHFSNLVIGFTFYFVFYHSFPSIFFQMKKMYGKISYQNIVKYLKQNIALWAITIAFSIALYYFFYNSDKNFSYFVFGFLIAIAASHTLLFHQFNKVD